MLLKTAIAEVTSQRLTTNANILFDEGAQRSFITQQLADELELRRDGSDLISLATFGSETKNMRYFETATIYVCFIEQVSGAEKNSESVLYIPHHGVKKESSTTPVRIVYDCSCRQTPYDPSLNDCLESSPPDLNDLLGMLLRFRMDTFAISTDI